MTVFNIVTSENISYKFSECWKQLNNLFPNLTNMHKYYIALWWCGKLPKILRPLVINVLYKHY
jgi:hypothetical protein